MKCEVWLIASSESYDIPNYFYTYLITYNNNFPLLQRVRIYQLCKWQRPHTYQYITYFDVPVVEHQ